MKIPEVDDKEFERMSTNPVHLKPFDPHTKAAALELMAVLDGQLTEWDVASVLHGSTALEIEGKGEIEVAVYLDDERWDDVKAHLFDLYGQPWCEEDELVNINTVYRGIDVEIILLRGDAAVLNRALMDYLLAHPEACAEYVTVKRTYAFSRRVYYRQKTLFFNRILKSLPEPAARPT